MSALVAVSKPDRIEILTDAAFVRQDNGVAVAFACKQFLTAIPNCAIAHTGFKPPCEQFALLAQQRGLDLDALILCADDLWREARDAIFTGRQLDVDYGLVIAGWSQRHHRLELRSIDSQENHLSDDLAAIAFGPTDEAHEVTSAFVSHFRDNPEEFDAKRDGIAFMQAQRCYRRRFGEHACPTVGGFVQLTSVTQTGAASSVIHTWADRIGEQIREAA